MRRPLTLVGCEAHTRIKNNSWGSKTTADVTWSRNSAGVSSCMLLCSHKDPPDASVGEKHVKTQRLCWEGSYAERGQHIPVSQSLPVWQ